jgi:hypothetical protein
MSIPFYFSFLKSIRHHSSVSVFCFGFPDSLCFIADACILADLVHSAALSSLNNRAGNISIGINFPLLIYKKKITLNNSVGVEVCGFMYMHY